MARRTEVTTRPDRWTIGERPDDPDRVVLMFESDDVVHALDLTEKQAEEVATKTLEYLRARRTRH